MVRQARKLGKHATKTAAVTAALIEYIQHLKQLEIVSLFGTVDFDPVYDYKRGRQRKPIKN